MTFLYHKCAVPTTRIHDALPGKHGIRQEPKPLSPSNLVRRFAD